MNKDKLKIDSAGNCLIYLFQCHESRVDTSKLCQDCIEAQKKDFEERGDKVINHLEAGKSLTKLQCISLYSYINLGNIIYVIRKAKGYNYINTVMKKSKVTGARFAVYQKA